MQGLNLELKKGKKRRIEQLYTWLQHPDVQ